MQCHVFVRNRVIQGPNLYSIKETLLENYIKIYIHVFLALIIRERPPPPPDISARLEEKDKLFKLLEVIFFSLSKPHLLHMYVIPRSKLPHAVHIRLCKQILPFNLTPPCCC